MIDYKAFGTAAFPLHPSGLQNLLVCPWREVMAIMLPGTEDSGPAADTGSAMHKAAAIFHKEKKGVAECIAGMAAGIVDYPKADLEEAAGLFLAYYGAEQPGEVVLCEEKITFTIAASTQDPTGEAIVIEGTLDQVRRTDRLKMWDIKTSKKDPIDVLRDSMHQAAAYCVGASMLLGEQVHPGGLIMPRRKPMFIPFSWTWKDIEDILAPVRDAVALIRSGIIHHVPNSEKCKWCVGPELCLPRKRKELNVLRS